MWTTHDPAVRAALPTAWMSEAYDRWKRCFKLGTAEPDLLMDWEIATLRERRGATAT